MRTALLAVSFGTTHPDALRACIEPTEAALAAALPQLPLFRAFTSGIVRARLAQKRGLFVDDVEGALARIRDEGFAQVLVQPTLLIPGEEYDRLLCALHDAAGGLKIAVGKPLLRTDADLTELLSLLRRAYPTGEDTVLLAMGHGTYHASNGLYLRLAELMQASAGSPVRLATVEGSPSFEDAIAALEALPQRKVRLVPLLFVAGDHAKNDMAGREPGSLRALLEARGFSVECTLQGLGAIPAVRQLYVRRAKEALQTL